ncbi:MAG: tetratricopeptide repeat protein [Flavobacteriaceae bacterium]|nr:tetratricopeptide repeat protein [Flavobacteriaceae bacterium]
MQKKILLFIFLVTQLLVAQKPKLALSFFKKGDYKEAIMLYKPLHEKNPIHRDYFKNLLISYQQIEKYADADKLVRKQIEKFPNQVYLNIEIGYNYQLQDQIEKAKQYYEETLNLIKTYPNYGFSIGQAFKQNYLLDYALKTYKIAKTINPELNTEISEAQIYGEKGDLKKMFNSYLNLIEKDQKYYSSIQRHIAIFITDDSKNKTNILFKNLLLKRAQSNPNNSWNILLSWLFMQQKEYNKAFTQEKSLFQRKLKNLDRIIEVGLISFENNELETAQNVFNFVLRNTQDSEITLYAQIYLLQIDNQLATTTNEFEEIDKKYQNLFEQYGKDNETINLQIAYANFLSFTYNQPEKAIKILNRALVVSNSKFQEGSIQIKLADVLVYTNQFNQALLLYSQVQTELKNSILAQTARFKVAQTSYFKGDFKWAQIQLKVLKSSTSQLIANDALNLNLLITNNIENDSIHDALKGYATADLLAFQNKNKLAIDTLTTLLIKFKGQPIEDEALFKQAELFTKTKNYTQAKNNYLKIIEINQDGILIDDASYYLAELYRKQLNNSEKAKVMYQKIIFEFPSSIYLVKARKKYRELRGEIVN